MRFTIEHIFGDGHVDHTVIDVTSLEAAAAIILRLADDFGIHQHGEDDGLPIALRLCQDGKPKISVTVVRGGLARKASQRSSAI